MIERNPKHPFVTMAALVVLLLASQGLAQLQLQFPGPAPGRGRGRISKSELVLENRVLSCTWGVSKGHLKPKSVTDKLSATTLQLQETECFKLV